MALLIDIRVTNGRGGLDGIEAIEVRRLERLHDPVNPADEVHAYKVTRWSHHYHEMGEYVNVTHRYGDGARVLAVKALTALTQEES